MDGLTAGSVTSYHDNNPTSIIAPGSGMSPSAILALTGGDLLIANSAANADGNFQVMEYNGATTSPFITLNGDWAGDQPRSLLLDTDGNLLVGISLNETSDDGAVLKFNIGGGAPLSTIDTGIGAPTSLALAPVAPSDVLFSTYFLTNGNSVVRYNDATQLPAAGSVATGFGGLKQAEGLAVAPDGSYYVSSDATDQVLHFSNSGALLGVLGANDATQCWLEAPGSLAFGPNGSLYVADLGSSAIFQFDTTLTTQQYLAADTLWLSPGFTPGGFTFAADSTGDLIVGSLEFGSVDAFTTTTRPR